MTELGITGNCYYDPNNGYRRLICAVIVQGIANAFGVGLSDESKPQSRKIYQQEGIEYIYSDVFEEHMDWVGLGEYVEKVRCWTTVQTTEYLFGNVSAIKELLHA